MLVSVKRWRDTSLFTIKGAGCAAGSKRDTGVRYADVAGIDAIKADIQEVLEIMLGNDAYDDMGALPMRVSTGAGACRHAAIAQQESIGNILISVLMFCLVLSRLDVRHLGVEVGMRSAE